VVFTPERVRSGFDGPLDWRNQVLPALIAEMHLTFYTTLLRRQGRDAEAERMITQVASAGGVPNLRALASRFGVGDHEPPDLDRLATPFTGRTFASPEAFEAVLLDRIAADVAEAALGNVTSPLKASLDLLRSLRWVIRELADFSGLTPASHRDDLIGWYSERSAFLAAGPPILRLRQLRALIEAGVVQVTGPQARYTVDAERGRYVIESPCVLGSAVTVDTVVDARIAAPDLDRDESPLTRRLVAGGAWTAYVNRSGSATFRTGGVAVTRSPFHPIGRDGQPDRGAHVLGIPTEHTRWFTQVVATGPRRWSDFMHNADDIAADLLRRHEVDTGRSARSPVSVAGS
jgi:hypothetical protein